MVKIGTFFLVTLKSIYFGDHHIFSPNKNIIPVPVFCMLALEAMMLFQFLFGLTDELMKISKQRVVSMGASTRSSF